MVRAVRTWLRRAIATTAAVLTLPVSAVVSDVTPIFDANADSEQSFNANGLESLAFKSNKDFQIAYTEAGGTNATFQFPPAGSHAWAYWGAQVQAPQTRPDRNTQRLRATRDDTRRIEQPQRFVVDCTGNAAGSVGQVPRAAYDRWDR